MKREIKPFISVCTPTYNRRPFIPYIIKCFLSQDYPQDKMEWIILDDGTDKIHDLVKDISNIKYYSYDKKIPLGEKRNLMHSKCRGSIIVYMDDDDYYPRDRVSHAVEMLTSNPKALCAGSSIMHVYFKHLNSIYQLGPYGPNHATAGTFAFKKELLKFTSYDEKAVCSEEKHFLKNYTIPFIQLDSKKTILVITHPYNTFDKKKLLINPHPQYVRETILKVDDFIKIPDMRDFYMNRIHGLIKKYKPNINEAIKETDHVESVST
jgi:glycosyltransferase involved in cell wall biosynthesis